MSRSRFTTEREPRWNRLGRLLTNLESRRTPAPDQSGELPSLYRSICEDLSLARYREYGPALETRLNALALRAYHQLHGARLGLVKRLLRFITVGFPRAVRSEARLMMLCSLLFWGPFLGFLVAGSVAPEWVFAALPSEMAATLGESFGGDGPIQRRSESDVMMFGHYIRNNVGIDFRTYSAGLLAGVGALYVLTSNAIVLGAAFGYAWAQGFGETFLRFVVGHGAPELWALVISGAAGLRLGLAWIAPGRRPRNIAMREDGLHSLKLVVGAGFMTTCAAFIEAFWSATDFSLAVKLSVGGPLWVFVPLWLLLAGRRS